MPEGPTIVTFKKRLNPFEGQVITEAGGYNNPYSEEMSGQVLEEIGTYGKYLILQFKDFFITVHFGLYGSLLINDYKKVNPALMLRFGNEVVNFYVVKIKRIALHYRLHFDMALHPFDASFSPEKSVTALRQQFPKQTIGFMLMNQQIFPGLGNIIRNEILFFAGIHPESIIEKIPAEKLEELVNQFQEFSIASTELIEQGIWKSTASVYKKADTLMYIDPKLKRKTFVNENVQKLYN